VKDNGAGVECSGDERVRGGPGGENGARERAGGHQLEEEDVVPAADAMWTRPLVKGFPKFHARKTSTHTISPDTRRCPSPTPAPY